MKASKNIMPAVPFKNAYLYQNLGKSESSQAFVSQFATWFYSKCVPKLNFPRYVEMFAILPAEC